VRVKALATLRFVEQQANAIFQGSPGAGQPHVAVTLASTACQRGFSIDFTPLNGVVQQLKTADHRH
jgi:DNA replication protein DnaC